MTASEEVSLPSSERAEARTALEDVFRVQYPHLVNLLARITSDRGQAEELASEVFCRLSSRPALFRPETNLQGWLYRTALNLGLDALRAESRRRRREGIAGTEAARSSNPDDPLAVLLRAERRLRVRTALARLKPASAKLLLLRHAGFSYAGLAEVLNLKPTSIGTLLARAAEDFEKRFRSMYGGEK